MYYGSLLLELLPLNKNAKVEKTKRLNKICSVWRRRTCPGNWSHGSLPSVICTTPDRQCQWCASFGCRRAIEDVSFSSAMCFLFCLTETNAFNITKYSVHISYIHYLLFMFRQKVYEVDSNKKSNLQVHWRRRPVGSVARTTAFLKHYEFRLSPLFSPLLHFDGEDSSSISKHTI